MTTSGIEDLNADDLTYLATVLNDMSRFNDARFYMKRLIELKPCLNRKESFVFGLIVKAAIDPLRTGIRNLKEQLLVEKENDNIEKCTELENMIIKIKSDLLEVANDTVPLIESALLPNVDCDNSKVFYLKLLGDFERYSAEVTEDDPATLDKAEKAYSDAIQIASQSLSDSDPIRLGVILNYAVFKYEHRDQRDEARELLKDAISKANNQFDELSEASKTESNGIIHVMNGNLMNWADVGEEEEETIQE